jgi:hypothetical protein
MLLEFERTSISLEVPNKNLRVVGSGHGLGKVWGETDRSDFRILPS